MIIKCASRCGGDLQFFPNHALFSSTVGFEPNLVTIWQNLSWQAIPTMEVGS